MKSLIFAAALSVSALSVADEVKPPVVPGLPSLPSLPTAAPAILDASFPHGLSLVEFARVVLQDVLREPFIFSSDFLDAKAQVGFSAKQLKKSGSESLLREVLRDHGYVLTKAGGYYRVVKLDERKELTDFWYTPRYRSVAYLSSIVRPLFNDGSFSYDRQLSRQGQAAAPSASGPAAGSGASSGASTAARPVDDGKSLYAMSGQTDVSSFLFRGSPSDVGRLKAVLAQVDVAVPKVLVRALVMEVSSTANEAWGVSAVSKLLSDKLGVSLSGNVSGMSGNLTFKGPDFEAVAGVFGNQSNVSVLTSPSIYAEAGAVANLSVGSSVPVLGAIQYSPTGDQARQSVEYRDTGVILRFTPRVYEDAIGIDLTQEISDAVATTTGVAGSPTLLKRSLNTTLNLSSGEYVVVGGLSSSKGSGGKDYVPLWESVKFGLGASSAKSSTEVVIVLYVERV